MGSLSLWHWLIVLAVILLIIGAARVILRLLPRGRWKTWPVSGLVFLASLASGLSQKLIGMEAIGFALVPSALALIVCAVHNWRAAKRAAR
jgi:hypothetical protein